MLNGYLTKLRPSLTDSLRVQSLPSQTNHNSDEGCLNSHNGNLESRKIQSMGQDLTTDSNLNLNDLVKLQMKQIEQKSSPTDMNVDQTLTMDDQDLDSDDINVDDIDHDNEAALQFSRTLQLQRALVAQIEEPNLAAPVSVPHRNSSGGFFSLDEKSPNKIENLNILDGLGGLPTVQAMESNKIPQTLNSVTNGHSVVQDDMTRRYDLLKKNIPVQSQTVEVNTQYVQKGSISQAQTTTNTISNCCKLVTDLQSLSQMAGNLDKDNLNNKCLVNKAFKNLEPTLERLKELGQEMDALVKTVCEEISNCREALNKSNQKASLISSMPKEELKIVNPTKPNKKQKSKRDNIPARLSIQNNLQTLQFTPPVVNVVQNNNYLPQTANIANLQKSTSSQLRVSQNFGLQPTMTNLNSIIGGNQQPEGALNALSNQYQCSRLFSPMKRPHTVGILPEPLGNKRRTEVENNISNGPQVFTFDLENISKKFKKSDDMNDHQDIALSSNNDNSKLKLLSYPVPTQMDNSGSGGSKKVSPRMNLIQNNNIYPASTTSTAQLQAFAEAQAKHLKNLQHLHQVKVQQNIQHNTILPKDIATSNAILNSADKIPSLSSSTLLEKSLSNNKNLSKSSSDIQNVQNVALTESQLNQINNKIPSTCILESLSNNSSGLASKFGKTVSINSVSPRLDGKSIFNFNNLGGLKKEDGN